MIWSMSFYTSYTCVYSWGSDVLIKMHEVKILRHSICLLFSGDWKQMFWSSLKTSHIRYLYLCLHTFLFRNSWPFQSYLTCNSDIQIEIIKLLIHQWLDFETHTVSQFKADKLYHLCVTFDLSIPTKRKLWYYFKLTTYTITHVGTSDHNSNQIISIWFKIENIAYMLCH